MKTRIKALILTFCALLLVAASVLGTMAYLTASDEVINTFTAGKVSILLDEAKANPDGTLVANAPRVKANDYKMVPGHSYSKDPTVTVLKNSEESYIRMTVTVSNVRQLDAIALSIPDTFTGYDSETWILKATENDTVANTRTYHFWYKATVSASQNDIALVPLFTGIQLPSSLTASDLATLEGMTITVNAYAIQKDGFDTPEAAWEAFGN